MDAERMNQIEIVVRAVREALMNNKTMLLMTEFGDARVFNLSGTGKDLIMLAIQAMQKERKFETVFDVALKIHHKKSEMDDMNNFLEMLKQLVGWSPLDCDNCPLSDNCEVKDEVECAKNRDNVEQLINKIFKHKKEDDENERRM